MQVLEFKRDITNIIKGRLRCTAMPGLKLFRKNIRSKRVLE